MTKKVLIISASFRQLSNSNILAHEAEKGALENGHEVEFINLRDRNINFCRGCMVCQKTLKCVIKDEMNVLVEKVKNADVLIFATPIYYYEMSGQLKTFLDRCNPLHPIAGECKFREIYLIATAQDTSEHAADAATSGLLGWITCFDKACLSEILVGGGVTLQDEIKDHPDLLLQAYELGKNI